MRPRTRFTDAWLSHYEPSPKAFPIVYYVNLFYLLFIPLVLGGMLFFVITDIYRRMKNRRRRGCSGGRRGGAEMSEHTSRSYVRWPLARRIEHIVMLSSFIILGLTGLPQKFSTSPLSIAFVGLLGGIENLRLIHHTAAIVMMLGTIWHILFFGYMAFVVRTRLSMLPSLQDVKDGWQALMYNLGFSKSYPQMGRYTFEEKMEYWAFVWGVIVMGTTGFMMWNPITTVHFLPGEVIPAAKTAHGWEAVLAILAIIIWHMYGVHIKRFNKSMFTGKMSEAGNAA